MDIQFENENRTPFKNWKEKSVKLRNGAFRKKENPIRNMKQK